MGIAALVATIRVVGLCPGEHDSEGGARDEHEEQTRDKPVAASANRPIEAGD
jgi:hypothetical protein